MDMHIDLKVGFDEPFSFDSQLPYSSSSGSFSSASTSSSIPEPFTPTSGRSTPGFRSVSMEHEPIQYQASGGYELTPPSSAFSSYYPHDVKADFHRYMEYHSASPSPSRKSSFQAQTMEMEYAPMIPNTYPPLPSQDHGLEAAHPHHMGQYSFAEYVPSPSPFQVSAPGYPVDNACASSAWAWAGDSPVSLFGRGSSPSPSQPLPPRDRNVLTPSYLASQARRRVNMDKVQQKSSVLHRVQQDKSGVRIERIAAAKFKCNYPNCQKPPFKRQEHLKRHKITKHAENPLTIITPCPICDKPFNRKDNYRQHLKLHTLKHRPTRRTDYHPDAQAILDEEMNKTKQRSQLKKKGAVKDEDEL